MTTTLADLAPYTQEAIWACIGLPLLILGLIAVTVLLFLRWREERPSKRPGEPARRGTEYVEFLAAWITALTAVVVTAAGFWWGMYPWKAAYHEWRPVAGTVATVDSRRISSDQGDGSTEDKFVVTFQGNPVQYGVLDTRAATLRPGDHLDITCVRRWQWTGTHGYDCQFVAMTKATTR